MIGRIISTIISVSLSVYLIFLTIFYFLHENIKGNINELNYSAVEVVSTSGVLTGDLYRYLSDSTARYGNYSIRLKLEKQIKAGVYDTFFDAGEIVGRYLEVGDRLTVYLEDKNPTLFGRLVNATLLFNNPRHVDNNIKSIKTAIIARSAKNVVRGYDVIADIEARASNNSFSSDKSAIFVATKLNPSGKYYGLTGHPYVAATNLHYGDSIDESGNTGANYIFDYGNFLKETECYPDGSEKLIRYIQQ